MLIKSDHYLIEKTIRFYSFERVLYHGGKKFVLQTPASRILEILLKKQGEIVSYADIYNFVWQQNGVHVSSNTLHQHISQIRKVLKQVGIIEEVISTTRGKGLVLSPTLQAEFITREKIQALEFLAKNITDAKKNDHQEQERQLINPREIKLSRVIKLKIILTKIKLITFLLTVLTAALFTFLMIHLYHIQQPAESYFSYYKQISRNNGCNIFVNPRAIDSTDTEDIFNQKNITCGEFNNVYITKYQVGVHSSIIKCKDRITREAGNICISEQYLRHGGRDENN